MLEALEYYRAPMAARRFVGYWVTTRSFRLHLSRPYHQNRGIPQGGVLSPLMWLLLVNRVPEEITREMSREMPEADPQEELLLQLFADDISAVVSAPTEEEAVRWAYVLVGILVKVLEKIGLRLSTTKCKDFMIQILQQQLILQKRRAGPSRWPLTRGRRGRRNRRHK